MSKEKEPLFSKKNRALLTDPLDDDNPITVPELASGEMTINQVLNMMRTGKIERTRMVENDKGEMVEEKYLSLIHI